MKKKNPIAIVGMAGLFPGAHDIEDFWQNIVDKKNTSAEIPHGRWITDPQLMYRFNPTKDKAYSNHACLIKDFLFDGEGLDIENRLLRALDPLYHIVLHTGKKAFESCPSAVEKKSRTGVILAAIALPTDAASKIARKIIGGSFERKLFHQSGMFINENPISSEQYVTGKVTSLPAALLAKALGLEGGGFTLDAACASSIYAVKLACDELESHRADVMLAGGVSRPDNLYTQVGFSQLRALSPSGRCAPFDQSADGLVVGEGAGFVVLKRLKDAIEAGDSILGIVRGIGISNDIRGNLLAPDSEGQLRSMRNAYVNSEWSPHDIDLIECHGAGTPVGDMTELISLKSLWGKTGWSPAQCAIGSVKSMIGHLLTAAGAASLIKILLSLKYKTLPPSLHFNRELESIPISDTPFKVQNSPEPWIRRSQTTSLKAAINAFGFGGINGHLLLEEWYPKKSKSIGAQKKTAHEVMSTPKSSPIAVVGLSCKFGTLSSVNEFQEAVFNGRSSISKRPKNRWKDCEDITDEHLNGRADWGGYMNHLTIDFKDFHIPPKEIPDILPQQLLMLQVSAEAMRDAGLPFDERKPRMGVMVGMCFDFEDTDFHLRWNLYNELPKWKKKYRFDMDDNQASLWLDTLQKQCGPSLTATRTLGSLGGIVASRIAREFRLGGPSFVVSCEEASGIKALEIGIRSLQKKETDAMIAGAVDMTGDVRNILVTDTIKKYSRNDRIRPFDISSDGTLPGEGAAAFVLKRVEDAISDHDRVYGIIKGIGHGSSSSDALLPSAKAYELSLKQAYKDADVSPSSTRYFETHGSGDPHQDRIESYALKHFFSPHLKQNENSCSIGSVKTIIGHTGAVSGFASILKVCLSLYYNMIPPFKTILGSSEKDWTKELFELPARPQYWAQDQKDGHRIACSGTMTVDGNFSHVVLEEFSHATTDSEQKSPLDDRPYGLFKVTGTTENSLINDLRNLQSYASTHIEDKKNIRAHARDWHIKSRDWVNEEYRISLIASDLHQLKKEIGKAIKAVTNHESTQFHGKNSFYYSTRPIGSNEEIAFVFPGSGNHYAGMGRAIGVYWPEVFREEEIKSSTFRQHLSTQYATQTLKDESILNGGALVPENLIFGQVVYGSILTSLARKFAVHPSAVIGYSLGETAGYFATGAWSDREIMRRRMEKTNLFKTELAGPCLAARKVWNIPEDQAFEWRVAVVNRPESEVRRIIQNWRTIRLLIVNSPQECVIGGNKLHLEAAIKSLNCEAIFLEGVVTVHCDAVYPVKEAYRDLHRHPISNHDGIRYYSCALGKSFELTSETAADSILKQALYGFNFIDTVEQAYQDGIKVFLEMGPQASCTRMIHKILGEKPHLAISASVRGEDEYLTIIKFLGTLFSEGIFVDLDPLYENHLIPYQKKDKDIITLEIGGSPSYPVLPSDVQNQIMKKKTPMGSKAHAKEIKKSRIAKSSQTGKRFHSVVKNAEKTANVHKNFLRLSNELSRSYKEAFNLQIKLLEKAIYENIPNRKDQNEVSSKVETSREQVEPNVADAENTSDFHFQNNKIQVPAFSRSMCMEFAIGSIARVFGPDFSPIDGYKVRVRLPDEPLMLVDRIISVEGEKCSLGPGKIITEHDVLPGSWYLDGDRAPVSIAVEAGQADLFLCSYLGIDHVLKGYRTYRLLDANVTFLREMPKPNEVIRYEIKIDKFSKQGDTYLFFFNFKGFIKNTPLISMENGCAGFFTEDEINNSGGIILTKEDLEPIPGIKTPDFSELVSVGIESYDDEMVNELRNGNLKGCFGGGFKEKKLCKSLRLPGGRMKLIDRILKLDPNGGRYGIGSIKAEADIHPDAWFLVCHFMDDMVMPGTLMYECCAHTLRIYLQRIGWITTKEEVCYEPVIGVKSRLKCRGPVTPKTKRVIYEIHLKEIGYNPEPYAIADAYMYADRKRIVMFDDISLKVSGLTKRDIEKQWYDKKSNIQTSLKPTTDKKVVFDYDKLRAFTSGKPSEAFGEPYKAFDEKRVIARLPRSPYLFIDQIVSVEPAPWRLEPGGWIEAEFEIKKDAWFIKAEKNVNIPFAILLEIGLQPCGWLAAYLGSALKNEKDLKFRNLGGKAVVHHDITSENKILTTYVRLAGVSEAADMIIEEFDFKILHGKRTMYEGWTNFGFFTEEALSKQVGLRGVEKLVFKPLPEDLTKWKQIHLEQNAPHSPFDPSFDKTSPLAMPSKALSMIDTIETYLPNGGPFGLGFIRGVKIINTEEWFFKAHFYQDPVCPGSLGIESFLQLLKFMAIERWGHLKETHRFGLLLNQSHQWTYRGQIIKNNLKVEVEAFVKDIQDSPFPFILANGFLKVDGLYIYKMEDFGIRLIKDNHT